MKKLKPTKEEIARSRGIATADAFFKIFGLKRTMIIDKNVITPATWDKGKDDE
jgi:hypothetical protein